VSAKRVVGHQLQGHGSGERRIQATLNIDRGEFFLFCWPLRGQFCSLECQVSALGIGLGTDGNVFASGHRECTSHYSSDTREQDFMSARIGSGDAHHEACCRHDSIIRPKNRGAKPTDPLCPVQFTMTHAVPPKMVSDLRLW
jgi:hypothetical protein